MKHFILLISLIFTSLQILAQQGVKGTVKDAETGELLAFVTIVVKGTSKGVTTDFDGNYQIDLGAGSHTLVYSYISYENKEVTVTIPAGEYITQNVEMGESAFMGETITIVGVKKKDDEAAVIEEAKKAEVAVSATSSEEMQKKAVNNAQDAVKTVTGVAVDKSGSVNVRGMDSRYISVGINGMVIPGTDPERNSVQIDLIPTSFLNSIAVSKTFSPDQPGNSTGGAIDIKLKDMPKKKFLKVNAGISVNDITTFNSDFLTYQGGSFDWLGYDDGTRAVPTQLQNNPQYVDPTTGDSTAILSKTAMIRARSNAGIAGALDDAAKSVSDQMVGHTRTAPFNRKVSFSFGDTVHMGKTRNGHKRLLGMIIGGGYSNSFDHRVGTSGLWERADPNNPEATELNAKFELADVESRETPNVNGLFITSFEPWDGHKFSFNTMYNHSAQKSARTLSGPFPAMISNANSIYFSNTLSYMERQMINTQFTANHEFGKGDSAILKNVELNYAINYFDFTQDEPDLRFFSYDMDSEDSSFYISKSEYTVPSHFWRDLHDVQMQYKADLKIPFFQGDKEKKKLKNYFKMGGLHSNKTRAFGEQTYYVENRTMQTALTEVEGDAEFFFSDANMGIVVDENGDSSVANYIEDQTDPTNSYTGVSNITAGYGMIAFNPIKRIKLVAGARMENTFITVSSQDTLQPRDTINETDILPAANLIIQLDSADKWKLRLSASQTIARPTMREAAPFSSFAFIGGPIYVGNASIRRSLITNLDFRIEHYPRRGENITLAGYRKFFKDPISAVYILNASNDEITWRNMPSATLYGGEFEFRKRLDVIDSMFHKMDFNTNFSYIFSEMEGDSLSPYSRTFPGQSNYLANFGLGYTDKDKGLNVNLSGNYFSPRLTIIGRAPVEDANQMSQFQLNLVVKKKLNYMSNLSFSVRNILAVDDNVMSGFEGQRYPVSMLNRGRTYSLSIKFDLFAEHEKKLEKEL